MCLDNVPELKEKLKTEQDLSQVWDFFFDNFAESDEFLDLGTPGSHPKLEAILGAVGSIVFGREVSVRQLLVIRVPQVSLSHGTCFLSGCMTSFFYFDNLDLGMLALCRDARTHLMCLARFTSQEVDTGTDSGAVAFGA
jgi:hypothetical protein